MNRFTLILLLAVLASTSIKCTLGQQYCCAAEQSYLSQIMECTCQGGGGGGNPDESETAANTLAIATATGTVNAGAPSCTNVNGGTLTDLGSCSVATQEQTQTDIEKGLFADYPADTIPYLLNVQTEIGPATPGTGGSCFTSAGGASLSAKLGCANTLSGGAFQAPIPAAPSPFFSSGGNLPDTWTNSLGTYAPEAWWIAQIEEHTSSTNAVPGAVFSCANAQTNATLGNLMQCMLANQQTPSSPASLNQALYADYPTDTVPFLKNTNAALGTQVSGATGLTLAQMASMQTDVITTLRTLVGQLNVGANVAAGSTVGPYNNVFLSGGQAGTDNSVGNTMQRNTAWFASQTSQQIGATNTNPAGTYACTNANANSTTNNLLQCTVSLEQLSNTNTGNTATNTANTASNTATTSSNIGAPVNNPLAGDPTPVGSFGTNSLLQILNSEIGQLTYGNLYVTDAELGPAGSPLLSTGGPEGLINTGNAGGASVAAWTAQISKNLASQNPQAGATLTCANALINATTNNLLECAIYSIQNPTSTTSHPPEWVILNQIAGSGSNAGQYAVGYSIQNPSYTRSTIAAGSRIDLVVPGTYTVIYQLIYASTTTTTSRSLSTTSINSGSCTSLTAGTVTSNVCLSGGDYPAASEIGDSFGITFQVVWSGTFSQTAFLYIVPYMTINSKNYPITEYVLPGGGAGVNYITVPYSSWNPWTLLYNCLGLPSCWTQSTGGSNPYTTGTGAVTWAGGTSAYTPLVKPLGIVSVTSGQTVINPTPIPIEIYYTLTTAITLDNKIYSGFIQPTQQYAGNEYQNVASQYYAINSTSLFAFPGELVTQTPITFSLTANQLALGYVAICLGEMCMYNTGRLASAYNTPAPWNDYPGFLANGVHMQLKLKLL